MTPEHWVLACWMVAHFGGLITLIVRDPANLGGRR